MSESKDPFEGWAILELMGHRRLGGWLSEATLAGGAFVRIDIPEPHTVALIDAPTDRPGVGSTRCAATQFYSPSAVYCITPCDAEAAFAAARIGQPAPVQRWELPAPREPHFGDGRDDDASF